MKLFKQIVVPETCYLEEAALWLAFGRVPEFYSTEDAEDARRMGEADRNGYVVEVFHWFRRSEFAMCGIEFNDDDYERYLYAQEIKDANSHRPPAWLESIVEGQLPDDDDDRSWERGEVSWAEEQDDKLEGVLDEAKAAVFMKLRDGSLPAIGWRKFTQAEMEENGGQGPEDGEEGRFEHIPQRTWTLKGMNWRSRSLHADGVEYAAVQVDTDAVFDCFPLPTPTAEPVRMNRAGQALILVDGPEFAEEKRTRGRQAESVEVRVGVVNWAVQEIKKGNAPQKKGAFGAGAIEWAWTFLSKRISQTSAENYIKEAQARAAQETENVVALAPTVKGASK